jgi:hypothetical protein
MTAAGAPVATDRDFQGRGTPAQRLVGQPPDESVTRCSLPAATATPSVGLNDPAGQDRPVWLEALSDDFETQLVQATERGQVRASEGSVRHVEVFQMSGVGTLIIGRPRLLSGERRATTDYTLVCEEPVWRDLLSGLGRGVDLVSLPRWCEQNLELLASLEARWVEASVGSALLHFDPRADNQLIDDVALWLIDWSRSCRGAPWVDLVTLACSLHADGHDMSAALEHQPVPGPAQAHQVNAYLAALAGYWLEVSATPDPHAPQRYQRRAARGAVALLRHRLSRAP